MDGTLGAGGHARGILEASAPDGQLLGLDVDPQALAIARKTLAPYEHRIHLAQASYTTLAAQLKNLQWDSVDGIVLDLGASSMQFDTPERGFSFQHDAPLDMRFGPSALQTAADIVNTYSESELADVLYEYGEERDSRKLARAIVKARPLHTTGQLVAVIEAVSPRKGNRLHPATKTFQALRIAVNDEFSALETFLRHLPACLNPGGRVAILTFHSGEDRRVKKAFEAGRRDGVYAEISDEVVRPSAAERNANPRSGPAKLRWAKRS